MRTIDFYIKTTPVGYSLTINHEDENTWSVSVKSNETGAGVVDTFTTQPPYNPLIKRYAKVRGYWHDEPDTKFTAIVAIVGNWVEGDDDDRVFFYCDSVDEFILLFDPRSEDFVLTEVLAYSDIINP